MAKVTMEVQAKSLEITASVLEKINILVEREEESVLAIQVNTNEEQTKEEVVVTRVKQPKKEIKRGKTISTKMAMKEIDKPNQVDESQMPLITIMVM